MNSGEITLERLEPTQSTGWLERIGWIEKVQFAFLFGCLLGMSSPGFDLWPVAWIGLAPLLVLLRAASRKMEALITGFAFGMGYHLVSMSWFLGLFPLRWLGLDDWLAIQATGLVWILESAHESLLMAAFAVLVYCVPFRAGFLPYFKRPFFPYLLTVPLVWVFCQWTVGTSPYFIGMPVNQLAYSQHEQIQLIQFSRLLGSGSIDFLIVLTNAVVACLVFDITGMASRLTDRVDQIALRVGPWVDAILIALFISLVSLWGAGEVKEAAMAARPNGPLEWSKGPPVPVCVVQGNTTIEEEKLKTARPKEIAQRYSVLSDDQGIALVILPEGLVDDAQMAPGMILSRLKSMSQLEKKEIVVGTVESLRDGIVNGARIISPQPGKEDVYIKRRLVPLGEFTPLGEWGRSIVSTLESHVSGTSENFLASRSSRLLKSVWGKIGVTISFEVIYPELVTEEVRHGASLLVNLSNLSRFHNASLNKQLLAAASLRAVENGRYMVVATNTGISAVIDSTGLVTSMSYPNKRGVVVDTVQFLDKGTPFSRMWWL